MDRLVGTVRSALKRPDTAALIGIFLLIIAPISAITSFVAFLKKSGFPLTCVVPPLILIVAGRGILWCVRKALAPEKYPNDDSEDFRLDKES